MKIKSKTDVITNSSTEVFILETDKSLEEVSKILHQITSGFKEPEYLTVEKKDGVYNKLKCFEYYFYSEDSYQVLDRLFFEGGFGLDIYTPTLEELELNVKFLWYLWKHKDELNEYNKNLTGPSRWKIDCFGDLYYNHAYDIPDLLVSDFIKDNPLPKLPDSLILEKQLGKIGFIGVDDNSIPYEDWDTIISTFGGRHFHLG